MKCFAHGIEHTQISKTTPTYLIRNVMRNETVECCKITNNVSLWEIYNN
jgi:hypothetical protein